MVNPRELRIGNFYEATDGSGLSQVTPEDIVAWSMGAVYGKGIPLTEEWLLKMGFVIIDGNEAGNVYGYIGDDLLVNDDLKFVYMFKGHGLPNMEQKFLRRNKEFKHVHQLQNLYFALTGEELTIKEPTITTK